MVYNAVDGCKRLGCAQTAIDSKYWSKLEKGKTLIKVRDNVVLHVAYFSLVLINIVTGAHFA
jgi:hypothetical protein